MDSDGVSLVISFDEKIFSKFFPMSDWFNKEGHDTRHYEYSQVQRIRAQAKEGH